MTLIFEHHVKLDNITNNITENNIYVNSDDVNSLTALTALFDSLAKTDNALSKAQLKQAISKGALWLTRGKHTQRLRRLKRAMQQGDELHFYYNEAVLASDIAEAILISDESDYSVWYKPFGMLSQGSKWSDHCTIDRFAQQYFNSERAVFIVHRLDKAATGLILIAHSKKAAQALSSMFENRTTNSNSLEKYYQIIVHGNHSINEQPQVITAEVDNKSARSIFRCLTYDKTKEQSLIQVKIDSGRKHQIRVHAASVGLPVVGDRLHGIADNSEALNLQLCAVSLSFICPMTQQQKSFELPEVLRPQL